MHAADSTRALQTQKGRCGSRSSDLLALHSIAIAAEPLWRQCIHATVCRQGAQHVQSAQLPCILTAQGPQSYSIRKVSHVVVLLL
jgi:hypothetical protein